MSPGDWDVNKVDSHLDLGALELEMEWKLSQMSGEICEGFLRVWGRQDSRHWVGGNSKEIPRLPLGWWCGGWCWEESDLLIHGRVNWLRNSVLHWIITVFHPPAGSPEVSIVKGRCGSFDLLLYRPLKSHLSLQTWVWAPRHLVLPETLVELPITQERSKRGNKKRKSWLVSLT